MSTAGMLKTTTISMEEKPIAMAPLNSCSTMNPTMDKSNPRSGGDNYCLTHDLDDYYYGGYLYFAKCHYGATQSWSYWDLHWSNWYNGKCADIY